MTRVAQTLALASLCGLAGTYGLARADEGEAATHRASTAEETPQQIPQGYARASKVALREYQLGNYEEARAGFLEAHALFPNARSLRVLGKVEFELKNYLACIDYLERSLASRVRPLDANLREDVQQLLDRARSYVATYVVQLEPGSAELRVDGRPVDLGESWRLTLEVGQHEVAVRAPGYEPLRLPLEVQGESQVAQQLELRLQPLVAPVPQQRWGAKQWGLTGGAAALVLGTVVTVLAMSLGGTQQAAPQASNVEGYGTVTALRRRD